ncbi:MAG: histidine kinase [Bacteroidetes bacterium]|jgi:hypothetical protein|nr:histidine kinase [Bacteroidota bacterium]
MHTERWSHLYFPFWTLHLTGWGAYGLIWYLASLPGYATLGASPAIAAVRVGYYVAIGALLTLAFRPLFRRLWRRDAALVTLLPIVAGCALLGTVVWIMLFEGVKWPMDAPPFQGASVWAFARPYVSNVLVLLAWSALYFGIKYQRDLQRHQTRTLRAETLAREAQLDMLRYQLNPHFLFNTLNTLRALISDDNRRARRIVTELADFLRYSLLEVNAPTVPLREEIEVTRTYLAIEKIRFEERLQIHISIDPSVESKRVPPFLVHSLVENAVKHGMATSPRPLRLRLVAEPIPDGIQIEVANTGHLSDPSANGAPPSTGIGLKNVRQRLDQLFPDRNALALTESDGWVRARVTIGTPALKSPSIAS